MVQSTSTQTSNSSEIEINPSFLNYVNQTFIDCGRSLIPLAKTTAKVSLSALYLGLGLSLVGFGAYSTVYVLHKNYQFYFYERPDRFTSWYNYFFSNNAPLPQNLGYGPQFKEKCNTFSDWANLASGDAFCNDLANHSWKEINRPESTAAAIAFTILGGGFTVFLSSYAVIGGISLLGRSFQTFVSTINQNTPKH